MIAHVGENGEKHIASKAINQFPSLFSGSVETQLMKASRWWKDRTETTALKEVKKRRSLMSNSRVNNKYRLKSRHRRGRKRSVWDTALYKAFLE